jgi:hypothetical protein
VARHGAPEFQGAEDSQNAVVSEVDNVMRFNNILERELDFGDGHVGLWK